MDLKQYIEVIEDFPKKGISFKNINTLLNDKDAYQETVHRIVEHLEGKGVDYIVGPEARGFLFGAAVAYALGVGFIPVRKPGKLPGETYAYEYELEYGTDTLEIQKDALKNGKKVAIIDDLLATGGTVNATAKLLESMGAEIVSMEFVIELTDLNGREKNRDYPVNALVTYNI